MGWSWVWARVPMSTEVAAVAPPSVAPGSEPDGAVGLVAAAPDDTLAPGVVDPQAATMTITTPHRKAMTTGRREPMISDRIGPTRLLPVARRLAPR